MQLSLDEAHTVRSIYIFILIQGSLWQTKNSFVDQRGLLSRNYQYDVHKETLAERWSAAFPSRFEGAKKDWIDRSSGESSDCHGNRVANFFC
jgi:hypothetical protein